MCDVWPTLKDKCEMSRCILSPGTNAIHTYIKAKSGCAQGGNSEVDFAYYLLAMNPEGGAGCGALLMGADHPGAGYLILHVLLWLWGTGGEVL